MNLRVELKEAFKEVNKLQRLNLKKKQANDELKEKIEQMKKQAKNNANIVKQERSADIRSSPRVQKANFDSEIAMTKKESVETAGSNDDWMPVDFDSLQKMAAKFPADYASKLEVHLMQHEHYIGKVKKDNDKLTLENNLLKEEVEQNKFLVQQLATALRRGSVPREFESPGLPQVELADNNQILGEELFAGDLSNIYINPNEISINLQTNRMNSVVKPGPTLPHRETLVEVVDNLKGSAVFNFTKELENAETPDQSPIQGFEDDNWVIKINPNTTELLHLTNTFAF